MTPSGAAETVKSADTATDFDARNGGTFEAGVFKVALIGPDEERRTTVAKALAESHRTRVREFDSYPPKLDHLQRLLSSFDVVVVDVDSNPEVALGLVERASASDAGKFVVYSQNSDPGFAVRAMRAGAREYLILPGEQGAVAEAIIRTATNHREKAHPGSEGLGGLHVFAGSKGGSGVTTVACNVAIALAQKSEQRVLLVDLALPIGDAALCLGIAAGYSTEDALRNIDRLDASFLQNLLVKHRSGVFVLAAPTQVPEVEVSKEAIDKLIALARREFDDVIVDVGSRIDVAAKALFEDASTVYLVTQTGISELRNSNRLISQFFADGRVHLEIVINRFESRSPEAVNEDVISKALGWEAKWKIPDDQDAARALQHGAAGIAETRISRISAEMAISIMGRPIAQAGKRNLDRRGSGTSGGKPVGGKDKPAEAAGGASPDGCATSTVNWQTPAPIRYGEKLTSAQLNATASVEGTFVYTPGPGYVLPVGTHTLWVTFTPAQPAGQEPLHAEVQIAVEKATPAIAWPAPAAIVYGTPLGDAQLNAAALMPGKFEYSPAAGTKLPPGTHTLTVTFSPDDTVSYGTAKASVQLTVAKAISAIDWREPKAIIYGTKLSAAQLCATAPVPGKFEYTPGVGAVLAAGDHRLSVVFTPEDTAGYTASQGSVSLAVGKSTPAIEWASPDSIGHGTALSGKQLNATVAVPGTFTYKPAAGETLGPGVHELSVLFTPTDKLNYTTARASVALNVTEKQGAQIDWPKPAQISYGTALGDAQLNATASVPGTFVYAPSAGHILAPGRYTLTATFTPAEREKYATAEVTVELAVEGATTEAAAAPADTSEAPITWTFDTANPATVDSGKAEEATAPAAEEATAPWPEEATESAASTSSPADTESEWSFLTITSPHGDAAVHTEIKQAPEAAASGAAPEKEAPYVWTFDTTGTAAAKPGQAKAEHNGNGTKPHEIRKYKGAIYEKGDDGQWHLQKK